MGVFGFWFWWNFPGSRSYQVERLFVVLRVRSGVPYGVTWVVILDTRVQACLFISTIREEVQPRALLSSHAAFLPVSSDLVLQQPSIFSLRPLVLFIPSVSRRNSHTSLSAGRAAAMHPVTRLCHHFAPLGDLSFPVRFLLPANKNLTPNNIF